MGRFVKILFGFLGVVLLLLVAAAILVPMFVDPNDFKGEIENQVEAATGRRLQIEGRIELSVLPWLGLELNQVQLSNAPGFGDQPFVAVRYAKIRAKLIPLLQKRLEVDTVTLVGLRLNLARARDGTNNWDDLRKSGEAKQKKTGSSEIPPGAALAGLAISGVQITKADVSWVDDAAGQSVALHQLNLATGQLVPGEPVDLKLDFDLDGTRPQLKGHVALSGTIQLSKTMQQVRITPMELCLEDFILPDAFSMHACLNAGILADLERQRYELGGLTIDVTAKGGALPPEGLQVAGRGDLKADLAQQTLEVSGLALQSGVLQIKGELAGTHLMKDPAFTGTFTLSEFSLRDWLAAMALPVPVTADPAVLGRIGAEWSLQAGSDSITLNPMVLTLDDTRLTGNLGVSDFASPAVRFALEGNGIDLDRYLPPAEASPAGPASAGKSAAPVKAALFPLALLRELDVDGRFALGSLKVGGINAADVELVVKAREGKIQLDQKVGSFYQGNYQGRLDLDTRAEPPRIQTVNHLRGIQVGPLLKDMTGEERLTGQGQFNTNLNARGQSLDALRASLGGNLDFRFEDGAVKGINIAKLLRETKARLKGKTLAATNEPDQTDFSEISASAQVKDGVLRNRDLQGKSPLLRVTGEGTANLVEESMDYRVEAVIVGTLKGQGGDELERLKGVPIPVRIHGAFAGPQYSVDWNRVLEGEAKAKVREQIDKHKNKLLDRLFKR